VTFRSALAQRRNEILSRIPADTYATPTVVAVSPSALDVDGGEAVTLTVTAGSTASAVYFGSAPATSVVAASATTVTCVSPAHAAGAVTVFLLTAGGLGRLANGATFS